jgi:hypothetical protein
MLKRDRLRTRIWVATLALLVAGCTASMQAEVKGSGDADDTSQDEPTPDAPTKSEPEPPDAPTELIDDSPPGTITVVYRRSQITACAMAEEEGGKVCSPKTQQPHHGKGELMLIPVDDDGEEDSRREQVTLVFEDDKAEQSKEVELKKGRWVLEWKGEATAKERFKVVSKDKFEITLDGIAGLCELEGKACKLQPQKTQQIIELPEARGVED